MLDKRSIKLLGVICTECNTTTYKVFEIQELIEKIPKEYYCDKNLILELLTYFSDKDLIVIKYQDEKEVCLCPTQKARALLDSKEDELKKTQEEQGKLLIKVFVGSFLGNFLASLVALFMYLVLK